MLMLLGNVIIVNHANRSYLVSQKYFHVGNIPDGRSWLENSGTICYPPPIRLTYPAPNQLPDTYEIRQLRDGRT